MLILASSSPRRQRLLTILGVDFQVQAAEVDESVRQNETPKEYVLRLAHSKCLSIVPPSSSRWVVIAADTAVVDGDQILGKPANPHQAKRMLHKLSGHCHYVYTSLAIRDITSESILTDLCVTEVHMRAYLEPEIEEYVASGDPLDKAGAYAIQNRVFDPVQKIAGCYTNVVGLPLCHLTELLRRLDVNIPVDATHGCRIPQGYDCRLADKIRGNGS